MEDIDDGDDTSSTSSDPSELLRDLIDHVFLPKRTPHRKKSNLDEMEIFLLQIFQRSIDFSNEKSSFPQISPTLLTFQKWLMIQPREDYQAGIKIFMEEVSNIQEKISLPIYVANQNCTLLISKTKQDNKIQVSTYRSSLPNQMIMSHIGSPSLSFPETTEIIQNVEFLKSAAFAQHLYDLAVGNAVTRTTTTKGNHNYLEIRDVSDPRLVSDWLVGLLVPELKSNEETGEKKFELKKKIRDQVTMAVENKSSMLLPFRRCGMYMSLKATLHLKLLDDLGSLNESRFVYKLFIIRLLVDICAKYFEHQEGNDTSNFDLICQMLAKLGGRISKLRNFKLDPEINSEIRENIENMKKGCLEYTEYTVETISKAIKKQWNLISFPNVNFQESLRKPGLKRDYSVDLLHKIPELDKYIQQLINSPCHSLVRANEIKPVDRYFTAKQILQANLTKDEETKAKIWFYDTETYIKSKRSVDHTAFPDIQNILVKYVQHATEINACNPVAISQMHLVALKALQLVDSKIGHLHPFTKEYQLGIRCELFDNLLLPNLMDMKLLDTLVNYFTTRDTTASHSEVLSNKVKENSFSVRFAQQNNSMVNLRNKILHDTENAVRTRLAVASRARETCKEFQRQIAMEGDCTCEWITCFQGIRLLKCEKCNLQAKLKKKRKSVGIYERALPSSEIEQYAVVFEFLIPEDIAIWRDLLAFVKYEVFKDPIFNGEGNSVQIEWLNYDQKMLDKFDKPKLKNIQLCSTSLPVSKTHYFNYQDKPDLLHTKDDADYVAYNGMTCSYYYEKVAKIRVQDSIKNACTFNISTTANSMPYANLQKYMESTNHFQNSVIAGQSECHAKLSLREFIAFGSLRAGCNTQLRNLYEAIYTGSLSLNEEPVLALILQTIWQVGLENGSHIDFEDNVFATEFVEMLANLVKINSGNYSNSMTVLIAIIITRRIADLNSNLVDKCYKLMKEWREILTEWIAKIQEQINSLNTKTSTWKGVKSSLQKSLLETILGSLFTYFIYDSSDWAKVGRDEEDIINWFQAIYNWRELVDQNVVVSVFMKNLAKMVTVLPCKLSLETHRKFRNKKSLNIKTLLQKFITYHCGSTANMVDPSNLMYSLKGDNVLIIEYHYDFKKKEISFDLQSGTFLVNGQFQSTLPQNIKESKLFNRYFKDTTTLHVSQEHSNIYSTTKSFHGKYYKFYQIKTGEIVIREIQSDSTELYLLDPDKFVNGHISSYYVSNYTHWYSAATNTIYFRPDSKWGSGNFDYQLLQHQTSTWLLTTNHTEHSILSIHSEEFKRIASILERLEKKKYINVTLDHQNVLTAHLWRHDLKFVAKANGQLESVEYPGFIIHKNQFIKGTLVGLNQVLLLQNKQQKILLVPHATFKLIDSNDKHQTTTISMEHLKQPPYFIYEMDTVLKQLKPQNSKTAWLYLAALHAVTSSPLPDPFTQVTGTEMAVRILQSACVWSCDPYEDEAFRILKFIRGLSPVRKYYGLDGNEKGQIETIKWPVGLPSLAAFDGYDIIVRKLIEDNKGLYMLHKKKAVPDKNKTSENLEEEDETIIVSPETLRLRAYFRSLRFYNPTVTVNEDIFFRDSQRDILENDSKDMPHLMLRKSSEGFDKSNLLEISWIRWKKINWSLNPDAKAKEMFLSNFLIKDEPLEPPFPEITLESENTICDLFHLKFRENWLKLYVMAMTAKTGKDEEKFHQFTIILAGFALNGAPMQQLINLHYISTYFHFPELFPLTSAITDPTCNDFNEDIIKTILSENAKPFTEMRRPVQPRIRTVLSLQDGKLLPSTSKQSQAKYETELKEYEMKKQKYMAQIAENCTQIVETIKSRFWPLEKLSTEAGSLLESNNIQSRAAIDKINKVWPTWYQSYKLKEFIKQVQERLNHIYEMNFADSDESYYDSEEDDNDSGESDRKELYGKSTADKIFPCTTKSITIEHFAFKFVLLKINDFLEESSMFSRNPDLELIYTTGQWHQNNSMLSMPKQRKLCEEKISKIINNLTWLIKSQNSSGSIIYLTGISPRLDPVSILINLMKCSEISDAAISYFGALAVLWTHLKRINRLLSSKTDHDRKRELENPGYVNWSPKQYPQWLILELELNIMIRSIQVDVANQMINMPDGGGNGVTQLNMGEGKTSVIVPMLCSTLAKRNSQLCRVTVLSSMFTMNLNSLTFSIGGPILNRRVYTFKCKRDKEIDEDLVGKIKQIYEECLKLEGVVLTLPEHRLSFRLIAYDKILKEEVNLGMKILDVENWLRKYARDVLDESDELFSVKYQLVYTVGKQVQIDGREMRWLTCQKILEHVKSVLKILFEEVGPSAVEFDTEDCENKPHEFSPCRLLDQKSIPKFLDLMVDKVIGDFTIGCGNVPVLKSFLVGSEISRDDHEKVMQVIFKDSPDELQKILLLSGYLRREVLCLALMKRWRVEYGINPKGFRKMAVPFRAKDVAAEKTEFGHPDLAIILTHLSYYYSGLDETQLEQVFEVLKEKQEPEAYYSRWISKIPREQVHDSISSYKSINMKDLQQKLAVFEMLRKHKAVIDFWLSHCVFFRECVQFPGKLVMTPWDLCYERQGHPVTGFSGTNDSSILLSLMISQQNLPKLLDTNQKLEATLRGPENCDHKGFKMGITCKEILKTMTIDGLTVLVDAGALMLEYTNEQVAEEWLKENQNIEAVVYFNQKDELVVKCRGRKHCNSQSDINFGVSPYQGQLEKCGVFLDDQHTRGTDIKFPLGTKACVTIASKMKRDKLIQACMRMRKLGEGHTVTFYLSHDAYNKVMGQYENEKDIKTKRALEIEEFPRWEICAEILSLVPKVAKTLMEKYGSDTALEFHEHRNCPQEFPYVRLLSSEYHDELVSMFEDNILTKSEVEMQKTRQTLKYVREGYLDRALQHQWRTDYGINCSRASRLATAGQVEFENPEIAILCTYLSYYYSGLHISQFEEVLETLKEDPDKLVIYFGWVSVFSDDNLPEYRDYQSLKLGNPLLVSYLFETFRKHKDVINYWLIKCVFPVEFQKPVEEPSLLVSGNGGNEITTKAVLDWVLRNTKEFNDNGLLYWALAGKNYAQRLAAEDTFHFPDYTEPEIRNVEEIESKAEILAKQCVDDEVLSLGDMYGQFTENEKLYKLIPKWFAFSKSKLRRENRGEMLQPEISERFEEICEEIWERCEENVPELEHICSENCGMMEEEQEKELEFEMETEVEEERHNVRPGKATAAVPGVHDNVKWVVMNGGTIQVQKGIERLPWIFKGTSFWNLVQQECWGNEVYATTDFISVVKMKDIKNSDFYLRPINYLISCKGHSGLTQQVMVISQHEANELLRYFRTGESKCTLHMFSMRRSENQDLLMNNFRLQLPSNQEVSLLSRCVAPLLLASGNLYFENMEEQRSFVGFLGLVPKPWSKQEMEDYENGEISKSGFRKCNGRQEGFQRDPTLLVKKIVVSRQGVESEASHLMCLINGKYFVDLKM